MSVFFAIINDPPIHYNCSLYFIPNQPVDYRVTVNSLRSHGGGILDPDDKLSDVVDDREQVSYYNQ